MNLKILSLVIIGVCILLPDVCYAFLEKDVHLLNMQNGLADNTVSAVYKDKEGFVWFGTRNGLSRYDGRRITNFEISSSIIIRLSKKKVVYIFKNWYLLNGNLLKVCQNAPLLFFTQKPRLSQAGALLLPKDFVSLGIRISL